MKASCSPIGVFDSGVGGISVLKESVKLMPNEDFIYFGDSKNAPYGIKSVDEVKNLSFRAVELLLSKGAKAVVVACNTATSAAIEDLRQEYKHIPVIGIEPALKPAVELDKRGKIIVMATPMTLREKKFNNLMKKYGKSREIVSMPCAGLVELIEQGYIEGRIISQFIRHKFEEHLREEIAAVVLGCTHYPFIKKELRKVVGEDTFIIDGSLGTAKQLKRQLEEKGLLNSGKEKGKITIENSYNDKSLIELSHKLLNLDM